MKRRASCLNNARRCHLYGKLASIGLTRGTAATSAGTDFHTLAEAHMRGEPWPDVEHTEVIAEAQEWAAWWDAFGFGSPTKVEHSMSMDLPRVTITGHADAIWDDADADTVIVADWKRVAWEWGYPPIEDDLQLLAYGEMARLEFGRSKAIIMRVHVPALEVHSHEMGADDALRLEAHIQEIASDEAAGIGPDCESCLARHACAAYQERARLLPVLPPDGPLTDDQASKAIVALGAAKALVKSVEARLKDHVEAGGVIESDGKVWTPSTSTRETITDGDAAQRALGAVIGFDAANDIAKVSIAKGAAVKAIKKADGDPDAWLQTLRDEGVIKASETTRWIWKKK